MCVLSVHTLLKVVGYYYLSVLSMSVVGFKKKFGWGWVGGWVGQRRYRLRQGAIGTSYGDWHCSGAAYLVACIALLTLRAAHAKYGETRCTISSCLAL